MNRFMLQLIVRRIGAGLLTLLIVSAVVFFITSLLPGDAAQLLLGQNATAETVAALREQLGLDRPLAVRYCLWLWGMLHGDFGISFANHLPVAHLVAQMARMTRAAIVEQLESPWLEMALLKGVSPLRAVLRHALPNAVGPIANAVSLSLSYLFGGVIIIETIFSYPGMASQLVDAVSNRDLPLVQLCVMLFAACYLALLLIADVITIAFNPKWRG